MLPSSLRLPALLAAIVLAFPGCASHSTPSPSDPAALGALMTQRLGWMDEVAQVKQARSLPITDPKREAELLQAMQKEGAAAGLPPTAVQPFFSGQMAAARQCQAEWLQQHPHPASDDKPLPDLAKTVRPALDQIGQQMLTSLVHARASHDAPLIISEARQRLKAAGYSEAVIKPAVQGLEAGLR